MTEAAPARLQEIPNRLPARVRGLTCPSCGGALDVAAGLRVVLCPYCETRLLVLSEIGIRRLAVEPQIETVRAREIVQRWLGSGWNKDSRLRREARVGEAFLSFLPFFRVEADCLGFALGTEERRRTVGSGKNRRTETYEVDVERAVQRSFDRTYPALNVAEWGLQWIDLHGDTLIPFDSSTLARQGMVFPPTLSESVVKESALEQFRKEAEPSTGLKRVRFRFLDSLRERLTVIYYPLWVVRYRFDDRSYQVLVDAQDGSLGFGKAPGNDLYRALMLVATQAITLFIGTTIIRLMGGSFGSLVFIGVPMLAVLLWGWKKFRYGGVVVEGTGIKKRPGLGRIVRSMARRRERDKLLAEMVGGEPW
ncbi:MAG: hypothetical protein WBH85_05850 [Thermoanaerobaculia bacterium]